MSDSTEAGFLLPLAPPPDDDALVDLLQPIVAGIGGWGDASLVRPRWQPDAVPNQPDFEVDWCALGIAQLDGDTFEHEAHEDDGVVGTDVVGYSEQFDVLVSCYGPNASRYARNLRDGMRLGQNRAGLQALNIDVLYTGSLVVVPALQSGRWLRRVDIAITMRRYVEQRYAVRTVVALDDGNGLNNEQYTTPILLRKAP